jgi:hypothetical protein
MMQEQIRGNHIDISGIILLKKLEDVCRDRFDSPANRIEIPLCIGAHDLVPIEQDHGEPLPPRSQSPRDPNTTPGAPCLSPGRDILFVIATAPNPANSQLALSFDRTIESIQRAAGDRGFLFDRFVFPWDAEPHRQTDTEKKRLEEKRRSESEDKQGILL